MLISSVQAGEITEKGSHTELLEMVSAPNVWIRQRMSRKDITRNSLTWWVRQMYVQYTRWLCIELILVRYLLRWRTLASFQGQQTACHLKTVFTDVQYKQGMHDLQMQNAFGSCFSILLICRIYLSCLSVLFSDPLFRSYFFQIYLSLHELEHMLYWNFLYFELSFLLPLDRLRMHAGVFALPVLVFRCVLTHDMNDHISMLIDWRWISEFLDSNDLNRWQTSWSLLDRTLFDDGSQ